MDMWVAVRVPLGVAVTPIMRVAVVMVVMTVMVVTAQTWRSPDTVKSSAIVGVSPAPSRRNSAGSASNISTVEEMIPPITGCERPLHFGAGRRGRIRKGPSPGLTG